MPPIICCIIGAICASIGPIWAIAAANGLAACAGPGAAAPGALPPAAPLGPPGAAGVAAAAAAELPNCCMSGPIICCSIAIGLTGAATGVCCGCC